jgi:predicted GNAT family N-acyltransferase
MAATDHFASEDLSAGPATRRLGRPMVWHPDTLEVVQGLARIEEIERFRYSIYVAEQHKPLPAADHRSKRLPDPDDHSAFHFCIRNSAKELVGYARMHYAEAIPSAEISQLGLADLIQHSPKSLGFLSKVMVDQSLRGRTKAIRLIMTVIQYGCERFGEAEGAVGHCSSELVPLYTRMGFRPFGASFIDPYVGHQTPMVAIFRDIAHFEECHSPIASIVADLPRLDEERTASFREYFVAKRAYRESPPARTPSLSSLRKTIHASVPGFQNSRGGITLA